MSNFSSFVQRKHPGVGGPESRIPQTHESIGIARGKSALPCALNPGSSTSLFQGVQPPEKTGAKHLLGCLGGAAARNAGGPGGAAPQDAGGAGGRGPPTPVESSNCLLPFRTLLGASCVCERASMTVRICAKSFYSTSYCSEDSSC